jgi:hypothetical protein
MRRIVENLRFGLFLIILLCILGAALFWALSIETPLLEPYEEIFPIRG